MSEHWIPEQAVRILRAKAAELYETVERCPDRIEIGELAAEMAWHCTLLADFIERTQVNHGPTTLREVNPGIMYRSPL